MRDVKENEHEGNDASRESKGRRELREEGLPQGFVADEVVDSLHISAS